MRIIKWKKRASMQREWAKLCFIRKLVERQASEQGSKSKRNHNRIEQFAREWIERDGWKERKRQNIKRSVPSFAHKMSMLKEANNHFYEQFHNCPDISRERMLWPVVWANVFLNGQTTYDIFIVLIFLYRIYCISCVFQFYFIVHLSFF